MKKALLLFCCLCMIMSGCSVQSTITSKQPGLSIRINEKPPAQSPIKEQLSINAFGNDLIVAEQPGKAPFYGVLPRNVNVGYIILDVMFFAPFVFLNARSPYDFYEIDYDNDIIRYSNDGKEWKDCKIIDSEKSFAKEYFDSLKKPQI